MGLMSTRSRDSSSALESSSVEMDMEVPPRAAASSRSVSERPSDGPEQLDGSELELELSVSDNTYKITQVKSSGRSETQNAKSNTKVIGMGGRQRAGAGTQRQRQDL